MAGNCTRNSETTKTGIRENKETIKTETIITARIETETIETETIKTETIKPETIKTETIKSTMSNKTTETRVLYSEHFTTLRYAKCDVHCMYRLSPISQIQW